MQSLLQSGYPSRKLQELHVYVQELCAKAFSTEPCLQQSGVHALRRASSIRSTVGQRHWIDRELVDLSFSFSVWT
jgi:hypothetical protein